MPETSLSIPKRIMIAGTRAAVGIGLGWLLSRNIRRDAHRGARGALLAFNVINTCNVSNTINVTNTFPIVTNIATKQNPQLEHPAA